MTVEYSNRVGKMYFLREGKTKTGKPRYFFSSKQNGKGNVTKSIPEGYEIYEHPENAQVFLRKIQVRLITELEEQFVKNSLSSLDRTKRYILDCKGKVITIYESNAETENLKGILGGLLTRLTLPPGITADDAMATLANASNQHYTAMLRFSLENKEERKFIVERFCFRGSVDDWIYLSGPDDFRGVVKKYLSTLGTDEFFEQY